MNIKAENLSVRLAGTEILHSISFEIPDKSFTCVVGPNGSGKSTMLRAISKDILDYSGHITDLNNDEVAYLPQNLEAPPFLSILDVTCLGFYGKTISHEEKLEAAHALLEQCGIAAIQSRRFTDVSAGERQRTWLAFALAQSKDVILMDEPLSSIDIPSRKSFYNLLQDIVVTGKTIVVVTHDIDMAVLYSNRIICLDKGVKTFEGDPEVFQQKHPYDM